MMFLKNVPLFKSLSSSQLRKLLLKFQTVYKATKSVLYTEGEPVEYVYVVKSGEFSVTKKMSEDINFFEKETRLISQDPKQAKLQLKKQRF